MGNESLVRTFEHAGLKLELVKDRIQVVFGMGVRHRPKGDVFWISPSDSRVEVLGSDRSEGQVVLFVKEEARFFTERLTKAGLHIDRSVANIVREDEYTIDVQRRSDGEKRHFLLGHDERPKHYFIAQLPQPATTVRQAHEVLAHPKVKDVGRVRRQGENFFLKPTVAELKEIEAAEKSIITSRGHRVPIGPVVATGFVSARSFGGNPHIADELLVVRRLNGFDVFVRGAVRHREHDTVKLRSWHKVVLNTEKRESRSGVASMRGVNWID